MADTGAERADGIRRRQSARLDIGREADAAQFALPGGGRLAFRKTGILGHLERHVERGPVVTRIVAKYDRCLVRELGNEVAAAEFRRIDLQFAGRGFDDALNHIRGFGPACSAIGIHWRGVGVDGIDYGVNVGNIVLAGEQYRIEIGGNDRSQSREIGAHRRRRVNSQALDYAVRVHSQFGLRDMIAAMGIGEEAFAALGGPLDRTAANALRGPDANNFLRINRDLRAEAAAHVGRDDAQLVLGCQAVEGRDHQPGHMRVLAGGIERVGFRAGVIGTDRGAGLHGIGNEAVVDKIELRNVRGILESGIGRRLIAD